MAKLVTLEEDGPLGAAGTQVWVDDEAEAPKAAKKAAAKAKSADGDKK